jgi:hypothetical protein
MKKARKEESAPKRVKKDLDPMELCRVMAGLATCGAESCLCSGEACACGA